MSFRATAFLSLALTAFVHGCHSGTTAGEAAPPAVVIETPREVEASCGECHFALAGDGCDLAVRIDGHAYFVQGSTIDEHGDSHAADGLCNAVRKARVTGHSEGDTFVATTFVLLPSGG